MFQSPVPFADRGRPDDPDFSSGVVTDVAARALDNGARELLAVRAVATELLTVGEFDSFDDIFNDLIWDYAARAAREAAPEGDEPIDTTEVIATLESWFNFRDALRLLNKKAAL